MNMSNSPRPRSIVHKVISFSPRAKNLLKPQSLKVASKSFFQRGRGSASDFESSFGSGVTATTYLGDESNSSLNHDDGVAISEVEDGSVDDRRRSAADEVIDVAASPDTKKSTKKSSLNSDSDKKCCRGTGIYHTISQDEFFTECATDHESVIIHFFDSSGTNIDLAFALDRHMDDLARIHTSRHFFRINGDHSPILTSKFEVLSFPAVLALRKGEVEARLSIMDNMSTKELDKGKFIKSFIQNRREVPDKLANRGQDSFRFASYSNR